MESVLSHVLALVAGTAIASVAGLRAFLPLLAVGLAGRCGLLQLHSGAEWLAGDLALICFGCATLFEIAADKIPIVDHMLDAVGTFLRPAAAALAAYGVLVHWPTPWAQILAVLLGAGALAVHVAKTKIRLGSSVMTLGHANPLLSVGEDVVAVTTLVAAVLVPLLGLLLVALLVWVLARRARRARPLTPP